MRRRVLLSLLLALGTAPATQAAAPAFPGAVTTTVTSSDGPLLMPDNAALVTMLSLDGVGGTIIDVDVTLDLAHTQTDQLDITLISPSGTAVTLSTDNGAQTDDVFAPVTFDDQAAGTPSAPNVRNFTYVDGMSSGALQPEEALGVLLGEPADGPWMLVVVDDNAGQTGTLRSWSLSVTTIPGSVTGGAPQRFDGGGGTVPDNRPAGRVSTAVVSGAGDRLLDVDVAVQLRHPNPSDLDLYLTAPSGRRIDLVTSFGGGRDDLYDGVIFDDQVGTPIGDGELPDDGSALGRVGAEGALSAFLGEDPNGTWTLTAVDHAGGNTGTLDGWTLTLVTVATFCGDGTLDPGEQCDDGNAVGGDGCEPGCTPTPPPTVETTCGDCADDDGNGLVDVADPACGAGALTLGHGSLVRRGGRAVLVLRGTLPVPDAAAGDVTLLVADAGGPVVCAGLGALSTHRGRLTAGGNAAGGRVSVTILPKAGGRLTVRGRGLDLSALDDGPVTVGLRLGDAGFVGGATFRARNKSTKVFP